ncbi:glycoside hydrolase family 2 protein [Hufsiella ginkgonis]|uniref:DUF4982 domain-containing protein n=1 Tax=Hufsiella ginkgonis TaxID=2695274 RepID=A0A7K1Y3G0_9SPHI|nr:sugar-binding domain-containing protein [Hufsiella ginkgonis]MXV17815.1 DUF4982 domain-containing protein [Hufsiella ginkgonis]
MKKYLVTGVFVLSAIINAFGLPPRAKMNFNPGWKVFAGDPKGAETTGFDDTAWKDITLPHAWNEDDAFRKSIDQLPTGIAWYRKHFRVPAFYARGKIFIEFEGVRQAGEVYLNGKLIGRHENGVMAFGFDLTGLIKAGGDNVIAVRTDNAWDYKEKSGGSGFQWNDKNFNANYGGLSKNVWLHFSGRLFQTLPLYTFLGTTGTYVYADSFDMQGGEANIHASSEVRNEQSGPVNFMYQVEVRDLQDKVVRIFNGKQKSLQAGETQIVTASSRISGLHFWSWGYGYLYTITTRLLVNNRPVDEVITRTGFRKTAFKNGMFYLNDRVLMVHGYGQRTSNEWPAVGLSVPPWMSDYSNRLMVESNGNLVRWMHITPWKQDIESCDRVGLLQAMPAGDAEKDVEGRRWEQRKEVMRDAIIYNRNNPSIVFYECGNESISAAHMKEMKAIRNQYDPYGGRAIGSREMLDIPEAEYGGEMLYINKSATKPLWATEYSRDEGLRKYWDEYSPPYHKNGTGPLYKGTDASDYNRNQDSHAIENVARWFDYWHERPGTGERVSSGGVNIIFSDSNTHFRGEENYRRSGETDAMRIPKDGFFAHKVMWNGWVDPDNTGIHLVGHWNYRPGTRKNIYVVAAGEKVELFVNGRSLGMGNRSSHFLFTFNDVEWQPGTIKAISYDGAGKKLAEAQLKTAGEPAAIRLTPIQSPLGLKADGADLAMAEVEVVDAAGNRCPTAMDTIHFSMTGPAEWRGGIAQGAGNFILSKDLPVECGVNRVIIRSLAKAGKIVVSATAAGLKPASVSWVSAPVKVTGGLSGELPAAGLPVNLGRGPTPAGQSYTVSRLPLKIASATAGANESNVTASFDDNELSDWVNDGKAATAWVKYELKEASVVNEVVLKLNNFRTRIYPLRILVDGQEVFNGNTATGLGYFTAVCKPVKGKTITIRLTAGSTGVTTTGTELSGKKLDDGVARGDQDAKGTLSIIEVEIYKAN